MRKDNYDKAKDPKTPFKKELHNRNIHRNGYDFKQLVMSCPELGQYISKNRYGNESINFSDPHAVITLNRALLKHFYDISCWDIPENFLCPPIPGRADYIHYIADLLGSCNEGNIPKGKAISVLDIGVGANCIYPIIGNHEYGWKFTGTDIDPISVASAKKIVSSNASLSELVDIRIQIKQSAIFKGIIKTGERFDITMCNPPFHASEENAKAANDRKRTNLNSEDGEGSKLNFGGQSNELWTHGGEASFVRRMIDESSSFQDKCMWFSTLISKKNTIEGVYKTLRRVKAVQIKTINMAQGQKISRVIAWSFLDKERQKEWVNERWK